MADLRQRLWAPVSTSAVVLSSPVDRRRYFQVVAIIRSIAVVVLGSSILWSSRGSSPWLLAPISVYVYPCTVLVWRYIRRTGVLAPFVLLCDIVALGVFAAIDPHFFTPALVGMLAILAFNCQTIERRGAVILSGAAVVATWAAVIPHPSHAALFAAAVFPLGVACVVFPTQVSAEVMQRSLTFNSTVANALGLVMFESRGVQGEPTAMFHRMAPGSGIADFTEQEWRDNLHPADAVVSDRIDAAVGAARDYRERYRIRNAEGSYRWIEEIGRVVPAGTQVVVYGVIIDITEQVESLEQLARLDLIADLVDVGITVLRLVDHDDPTSLTVVWENQAAARMEAGGHVGERLIDIDRRTFDTAAHRGVGYDMAKVAAGGPTWRLPDAHVSLNGQNRLYSMVVSPCSDGQCIAAMEDVTELFTAHDELERLAYVDRLTDLPNLAWLREMIVRAPVGSTLFLIDLDQLGQVREAFGQGCADELITEVARVLPGVEQGGTLCRLEGGRFGLLTPPDAGGADLAQRIVKTLAQPVTLPNGLTLQASAGIGITTKTRHDMSADEMLRQSNVALTQTQRHRSGVESYDAQSDNSAPHRMMLLGELRRALLDNELELQYQPAIDSAKGEVGYAEGLLVWRHPVLGLLSAVELTEMVDLSNLDSDIVLYSLRLAIADQRTWRNAGYDVPVSINIDLRTLHDSSAVSRMIEVLADSEIAPHAIGLEVDQSLGITGHHAVETSLQRLADAGFRIVADHCGSQLSELFVLGGRIDHYKLDGAFVGAILSIDESLLASIIATCRRHGRTVSADDVHDDVRYRWLVDNGVDLIQGPYVVPAMTAGELTAFLQESGDRLATVTRSAADLAGPNDAGSGTFAAVSRPH